MKRLVIEDNGELYDYTTGLCGAPLSVSMGKFVRYRNSIAAIANPTKHRKKRKKKGILVEYNEDSFQDWV